MTWLEGPYREKKVSTVLPNWEKVSGGDSRSSSTNPLKKFEGEKISSLLQTTCFWCWVWFPFFFAEKLCTMSHEHPMKWQLLSQLRLLFIVFIVVFFKCSSFGSHWTELTVWFHLPFKWKACPMYPIEDAV